MSSVDLPEYRAEMGFSHRELLGGLPSAVDPYSIHKQDPFLYLICHEDRVARLQLGEERTRKIAAITIPVTDVVIQFENFNEQQLTEFIDRFKMYLHKGGG